MVFPSLRFFSRQIIDDFRVTFASLNNGEREKPRISLESLKFSDVRAKRNFRHCDFATNKKIGARGFPCTFVFSSTLYFSFLWKKKKKNAGTTELPYKFPWQMHALIFQSHPPPPISWYFSLSRGSSLLNSRGQKSETNRRLFCLSPSSYR